MYPDPLALRNTSVLYTLELTQPLIFSCRWETEARWLTQAEPPAHASSGASPCSHRDAQAHPCSSPCPATAEAAKRLMLSSTCQIISSSSFCLFLFTVLIYMKLFEWRSRCIALRYHVQTLTYDQSTQPIIQTNTGNQNKVREIKWVRFFLLLLLLPC